LLRTGLIDAPTYLGLLAKTINGVLRGSGRLKQSVAESSFDAWTKYYRQDENAPNAIVSYYTKGSLVALLFDLTIRRDTRGRKSLDDVMRVLWRRYGRQFYTEDGGRGVTEAEVEALFDEVTGLHLKPLFDLAVRGTRDLPLQDVLSAFAVEMSDKAKTGKPSLDVRTKKVGGDCQLANVYEGGAAHAAGLSAGDTLVAMDGIRVSASNLDTLLQRYRAGHTVSVHAFRRDELLTFDLVLHAESAPQFSLTLKEKPLGALRLQRGWLKGR
jgi:predicted metalloprotease with PDZ domain